MIPYQKNHAYKAAAFKGGAKPGPEYNNLTWVRPDDWPAIEDLPVGENGLTEWYATIDRRGMNPERLSVTATQTPRDTELTLGYIENGAYVPYTENLANHNDTVVDFTVMPTDVFVLHFKDPDPSTARAINHSNLGFCYRDLNAVVGKKVLGSGSLIGPYALHVKAKVLPSYNLTTIPELKCGQNGYRLLKFELTDDSDLHSITDISEMFYYCHSLSEVKLDALSTATGLLNLKNLFSYCISLRDIDISSWHLENVTSTDSCFYYCTFIKSIKLPDIESERSFTTALTNIKNMFSECLSIKSLDLSSMTLSNEMFAASTNTNFTGCLNYLPSLCELKLPNMPIISYSQMTSFIAINPSGSSYGNAVSNVSLEALYNIIDKIADAPEGQTTTFTLHPTIYYKIPISEYHRITDKGYTLPTTIKY